MTAAGQIVDDPSDARARAAFVALAQGRLDEAERLLQPLLDHPDPRIAYLHGLLAMAQDNPQRGSGFLQRAAQALPEDAAVQANWALCLYQCDRPAEALFAAERAQALAPRHADGHYNRGLILSRLNRLDDAIAAFAEATRCAPTHVRAWQRLGELQHALGRYLAADVALQKAIDIAPDDAALHVALSAVLYDGGRFEPALEAAERARKLAPESPEGWVHASQALRRLGRLDKAAAAAQSALNLDPHHPSALKCRALVAQMRNRLPEAATDFLAAARLRYAPGRPVEASDRQLRQTSRAKLRHDIEQFEHLRALGRFAGAERCAQLHRRTLDALPPTRRDADVVDLPASLLDRLLGTYNRLHHIDAGERLAQGALNPDLDAAAIERAYLAREPGIGVIDELLRPEAITALRRYCLDSTLWFDLHHANGYLGAFFEDGFTAPLLLQIAEELRERLPGIFRDFPLTQLWAFKYDSRLDGIELHADIAAVNLNFWITPDEANLDPDSGGLVVWDKEAPPEWGFDEFNTSTADGQARIEAFLRSAGAQALRVPHRQNRAVLFNSDLFHRTDTIRFKDGYENRRINITMLFGQRVGRTG